MLKPADYKKAAKDKKVVLNWICAALMLILFIMQCVPYWSFEVEIPVMRTEIVEPVVEEPVEAPAEEPVAEVKEGEDAVEAEATEETAEEVKEEVPAEPQTTEVFDHMKKEKRSVSVNGYVWMPFNHEACDESGISDPENKKPGMSGLENYINKELGGKPVKVKDVMGMPIAFFIIFVITVMIVVTDPKLFGISVLAFVSGVIALLGYLTVPMLALGSIWIIHVVISALVALAGLATIIYRIINKESKTA